MRDKLRSGTSIDRPAAAAGQGCGKQTADGGGSRIRQRQRQRLIDACISALHIYGPSRTTVEKVVALADLSPGVVRFYFDSKAAMLIASLEYLATEFEARVLAPVARLKHSPVEALRLLVNLYLDADIASPRKVSVWYAFWGEASARQEYQDICGQKDEEFAALVRELMERLIAASAATHLDADGVALGLIGVLEVLWQGIAFESEANIDRAAAIARSLAYLRSVFPGEFAPAASAAPRAAGAPGAAGGAGDSGAGAAGHANGARLPGWAYADAGLLAAEREQLLRPAWQLIGHEAELPVTGDFLTADLAGERALVVRDERGKLHALRNTCRRRPHALLAGRRGRLRSAIHCAAHALTYGFDGRLVEGSTPGDLAPLELMRQGRLILVRSGGAPGAPGERAREPRWDGFAALVPRAVADLEVAADWKVIVEQWLESPQPQQHFAAPNQLLDIRPGGGLILQVVPSAPGRSRVRRFEFSAARRAHQRAGSGARAAWRRQIDAWLASQIELAQSTQSGLVGAADEAPDSAPMVPALAQFRALVAALLRALPAR